MNHEKMLKNVIKHEEEIPQLRSQLDTIVLLKENQSYNLAEFGIIGETNRDNAPDITDKLKEISLQISSNSGTARRLYVPKGYYKITDKVEFNRCGIIADNNATFVLDGVNANIKFTPYQDQPLVYESYIIGLGIVGQNGANIGLTLNKGSQIWIEKTNIIGFNVGLELINTDISHLIRPTIQDCKIAVLSNGFTGSSIENGNFWNNEIDFKFLGYNGGIQFTGTNYFENSLNTFLFDSSEGSVSVQGLYFNGNMVSKNESKNSKFAIFNGTSPSNLLSVNNFIIDSNKFYFKNLSPNFITVDFTNGNASNNIQMTIKNNCLYNEPFPDGHIIKAIGNNLHQLQVLFEDNITTSGNVNIVDEKAWIVGIDRSGSKQKYYNKVRGELLLDVPTVFSNAEGALCWNDSAKLPRFYDGTSYREIPFRGEYLANSTATDITQLKADFNNLLQKLRDCRVMKSY